MACFWECRCSENRGLLQRVSLFSLLNLPQQGKGIPGSGRSLPIAAAAGAVSSGRETRTLLAIKPQRNGRGKTRGALQKDGRRAGGRRAVLHGRAGARLGLPGGKLWRKISFGKGKAPGRASADPCAGRTGASAGRGEPLPAPATRAGIAPEVLLEVGKRSQVPSGGTPQEKDVIGPKIEVIFKKSEPKRGRGKPSKSRAIE